jgi:hypothetical protein
MGKSHPTTYLFINIFNINIFGFFEKNIEKSCGDEKKYLNNLF